MPRKCSICAHPMIVEINKMLVENKNLDDIITLCNDNHNDSVTKMSLVRHKQKHLPQKLIKAQEAQEVQHATDLFTELRGLQQKALKLLEKAEKSNDLRAQAVVIRECRANLELIGKVTCQFPAEQVLVKVEPVLNQLVVMLREEIKDPETLERISRKLLGVSNDNTLHI